MTWLDFTILFSLCFVPDEKELYIGIFFIRSGVSSLLRELDFAMSVSTRAYTTVWILSNDMMQQNNLTGKVGITLSLIDSSPIKAVLCFCFGQLMMEAAA